MGSTSTEETLALPTRHAARLRRMFDEHCDFIWRSIRRCGVESARVEDAAREVFTVAARRLDAIYPDAERRFLYSIVLKVASDIRRPVDENEHGEGDEADTGLVDSVPDRDALADKPRAREALDHVLAHMKLELRSVFVLFELERVTTDEIASILEIPRATVISRLRRAREDFRTHVEQLDAALEQGRDS